MTWNDKFLALFDRCLAAYQSGDTDFEKYYTCEESAFLASIGCKPREFFDFIEDFGGEGEPTISTALLIAAVRRDYFLTVQKGIPSDKQLTRDDIPSFGDELEGMAYLPRILAKGRAKLRGELDPDLMFDCGGDRNFLKKHGDIHPADFLRHLWAAGDDDRKITHWIKEQQDLLPQAGTPCLRPRTAPPIPTPQIMASTPIINLRKGHAVRHNNEVCLVIDHELKTPPRMASYVQMSIRSVATKKVFNLRMTSNDSVEGVVLERTPHEYSYKDSSGYHFLDPNTYEDAVVYEDLIEGVKNYLIEGQIYNLMVADGIVVAVDLPLSMVMTVAESSEGVKGDSANNVYKPAVMETGLIVQVPLFINVGERINVKTEDNSYTGRAN